MLNDIFLLVFSWYPSFIGIRFSIRYNSINRKFSDLGLRLILMFPDVPYLKPLSIAQSNRFSIGEFKK